MSRTSRNISHLPTRSRPFWKLHPSERIARGLCPHCGAHDPSGTHFDFGCSLSNGRGR